MNKEAGQPLLCGFMNEEGDMDFYRCEQVTAHIIRIRAFWDDACMYYIRGSKKGLLIDTGYGFGDLKTYVDDLADQPYDVVLSHGHLDHAGGAGQWADVYMNHEDLDLYHVHGQISERKNFLSRFVKDLDTYPDDMFIPMHDDNFIELHDGDEFDLGDVHVKAFHAPGHTHGMMVFLINEDRTMLYGDACGVFTLFCMEECTSIETFARVTLKKLKDLQPYYGRILRQHGTCESPMSLLDEDIAIAESIMNGTDDRQETIFNGITCFAAKRVDPSSGKREDGGEGNIIYIPEKVREMHEDI